MVSKAQIKSTTKYERNNYDKVTLRLRRDADLTRDKLQEAADAAGESLNAYVMEAVRRRMESDAEEKDRR